MNPADANVALLETAVRALGPIADQFVFAGGCATGLLVTDPAAPPIRATQDVDAIVEVLALTQFHTLERQLTAAGFMPDQRPEAPVCRWRFASVVLDVMPTDERVLGFGNRWFVAAVRSANTLKLPSGVPIRLINAPLFIATKLEAFRGRGHGDYLASHDLEDIVTIIDGRAELEGEVRASSPELQRYLSAEILALLNNSAFLEALPGHLLDVSSPPRSALVQARMKKLAGAHPS